jgi:lipoyl-dependent peroxiredoxin
LTAMLRRPEEGPAEKPVKKSPDVVQTFRSARHGRHEGLHYSEFFTGSQAEHRLRKGAPDVMKRSASAEWSGGLKDGKGTVSAESGVISGVPYNFSKRFENEKGTNPEELIAAAHAACFSMALSMILGQAGMTAEKIATKATVSLDQVEGGFKITSSHLQTTVKIPNADAAAFQKAVEAAKSGCPISKLLNATITMDAKLA